MIAQALYFYQFHSIKNRLLVRVRRMKEPRYLVGGIVGGAYFYFYFFRALHRNHQPMGGFAGGAHRALIESIAALVFLVCFLLMWILPHSRAALNFTEAEVAFLFPAPISRRNLINFKLLRLQTGVLISSFFMALVGRFGGEHFYSSWIGWWIILAAFNLHLLGSSFALTMMMDRGVSNWRRRILFVGGVAAAAGGLAWWVRVTFPAPPAVEAGPNAIPVLTHYLTRALESGPLPYLLLPFRWLLGPFFAANGRDFLAALPAAAGVLALHYLWVVGSNVAFEEASVEKSRRTAERVAAIRSGNWQGARKSQKASRSPFQLGATGFPAMALVWKNLIAAGSMMTVRFWVILLWLVVCAGMVFKGNLHSGVNLAVTMLILTLLGFSLFLGPNILRNDFRQDLPVTDMLKSLPLRGWQVALGEVLAPVSILTAVQWLLLTLALVFCPGQWETRPLPLGLRLAFFFGAALLLPAINFANLLIRNLAVLTFPAWFQLGRDGPRGFENTGQQLILVFGQVVVLALALIPPALAFGGLWLGASLMLQPAVGVMAGSAGALGALAVEAFLGVRLLGLIFDRFDLSSEVLTPD